MAPPDLPDLATMAARVAAHAPATRRPGTRGFHAATALVLTEGAGAGARMLVIRRATRAGDPWSGHAALPGGKREAADVDLVATARRETREEVGLELPDEPVGRLDDVGGRTHPSVVTPVVFLVDEPRPLSLQASEVAAAHWVPVRVLVDPAHATRTPTRFGPFPAWSYRDLTIWGLTHGVLGNFLDIVSE